MRRDPFTDIEFMQFARDEKGNLLHTALLFPWMTLCQLDNLTDYDADIVERIKCDETGREFVSAKVRRINAAGEKCRDLKNDLLRAEHEYREAIRAA